MRYQPPPREEIVRMPDGRVLRVVRDDQGRITPAPVAPYGGFAPYGAYPQFGGYPPFAGFPQAAPGVPGA